MNLGETIYKYRISKNMSQGDLAALLDVSRQSISKWENNSATPDLDKIIKLSEIFGVTIDELVKGEGQPESMPTYENENIKINDSTSNNFLGRKIAGTILLCMAFLIVLLLGVKGALGGGLILALPFIVCGVICFIIKQHTGLWCAWTIYFMIDIYLRIMTGTNRSTIFNTYYYIYANVSMTIALIISWALNLALIFLVVATILCFKNKPVEMNSKTRNMFAIGIVIMVLTKVFQVIYPTTSFYQDVYSRNYGYIHSILYTIIDWVQITIALFLIVNFVRYFFNKSTHNK